MSVLVTMRIHGDASRLEGVAEHDHDAFAAVSRRGESLGAIFHRFYAKDGEILVIDEWPDEESFHRFFDSTPEIPKFMAEAGVSSPPEVSFWHRLDLGDEIG
jgi:quinol monooxygenase YgiN